MSTRPPPPPSEPSHGGWSEPGEPDAGGPVELPGPRYVVGALIGRGGMGAVRAARDTRLGREVALKELAPELAADPVAVGRLAREAAITSRLDHPGIVSVFDVGFLPDGRPYYTMRLVRGRTLAAVIAAATPAARRGLVRHVLAAAEAVAVAHETGLVHRDLKPANILVGPHGETQVVDWGLAAPVRPEAWANLPGSSARGRVGTDRFMSPEQARGEPPDTRHDVWSLGRTLAEVVGDGASAELAAIVARATAARPEDRYPDAGAFAADLLSWFEGRRVAAYDYSPGDLLRRALAAYRLPIGIGALGLAALAVAVGVGWERTTASLARARAAEQAASARLAELQLQAAVAATQAGDREGAERLALAVLERAEDPLARGVFAAFGRAERPELVRVEAGPACAWSALGPGAAWVLCASDTEVQRWEAGRVVWRAPVHASGGDVRGDRVLTWDEGGSVVLDAGTGAEVGRWPRHGADDWQLVRPPRDIWSPAGPLDTLALPPSGCPGRIEAAVTAGARVAALCNDGTLVVGSVGDAEFRRLPSPATGDDVGTAIAFGPPGRVVVGTVRGRVLVLSTDDGSLVEAGDTGLGSVTSLQVSHDQRHVAVVAASGVGLWRQDTGSLVASLPSTGAQAVTLSDAGVVIHHGDLRTWRLPSGAPAVVRAAAGLGELAVAPSGERIAIVGGAGTAREVDLRDGSWSAAAFGTQVVKAAAYGPGGLLLSGMDRPLLAPALALDTAIPGARPLRRLAWLADGSVIAADLERGLFRWAALDAEPVRLAADRSFLDLERDGDRVIVLDQDGAVERLEGQRLSALETLPGARAVAMRGPTLAAALPEGVTLRHQGVTRELPTPGTRPLDVALSFDASRVAAGALDGRIFVWSTDDGRLLGVLPGHTERVAAVEFLPDGDLVSVSWDKTARVASLGLLTRPVAELAAEVDAGWGGG